MKIGRRGKRHGNYASCDGFDKARSAYANLLIGICSCRLGVLREMGVCFESVVLADPLIAFNKVRLLADKTHFIRCKISSVIDITVFDITAATNFKA